MSNFVNITALVPTGEHFDATAINEGVYFTEAHCVAIEAALQTAATNATATQQLLQDATAALTAAKEQHVAELATLQAVADGVAEKDTTIATLQAEIATLKQKPAGAFVEPGKGGDDAPINNEANKARYDDPNNPLNAFADNHLQHSKPRN